MAFATGDRSRIIKALNLNREQDTATSTLALLMADLERFDTTNSTNYVQRVQNALLKYERNVPCIEAAASSDALEVIDIDGWGRKEFVAGGGGGTKHLKDQQAGLRDEILNLLDPDNLYLHRYIMTGRVIRTL